MKIALAIFLAILCGIALAADQYSVGLSPNTINLGEVEPGSSEIISFRLLVRSNETSMVYLESQDVSIDVVSGKYGNIANNFSEEKTSSWVEFVENPIEVKPAEGEERSWEEANFFIRIPRNAEPGFHVIMIKPSISAEGGVGGQVGTRIVGVTTFLASFYVKGEAKRTGIILDVLKYGFNGENIEFDTYFQNTGKETIYARATQNISGKSFISSKEKVMPEEIKIFRTNIPAGELDCKDICRIDTSVNYFTGSTSLSTEFTPTPQETIEIRPEEGGGYNVWPLVLVVLILIVVVFIMRFGNG